MTIFDASAVPQKISLFGTKLYLKNSENFSCKLKKTLYNVDIRSKRERKKDKKMTNVKMKLVDKIISLRFDLDNYVNDRDWVMVRKIRYEIARLENMLSETY
jgi:hypothetical protein